MPNELYSSSSLEKQEKLRSLTLRVLLLQDKLQNKVQFLGHLVHEHFNQNSSVDFTVGRGKVKYPLQLCPS